MNLSNLSYCIRCVILLFFFSMFTVFAVWIGQIEVWQHCIFIIVCLVLRLLCVWENVRNNAKIRELHRQRSSVKIIYFSPSTMACFTGSILDTISARSVKEALGQVTWMTDNQRISLWVNSLTLQHKAYLNSLTLVLLDLWNSSWCWSLSIVSLTPLRHHTSNTVFPCWKPTSCNNRKMSLLQLKPKKQEFLWDVDSPLTAISSNLPKSSVP